jgi:vitamin B12/bleomycin/antimicrobial peptide transport system ATP-binding/permease protein
LLNQPAWLFLDEATSALDDTTQDYLYSLLASHLPNTSMVSIAHREDVRSFHRQVLSLGADGSYRLEPAKA